MSPKSSYITLSSSCKRWCIERCWSELFCQLACTHCVDENQLLSGVLVINPSFSFWECFELYLELTERFLDCFLYTVFQHLSFGFTLQVQTMLQNANPRQFPLQCHLRKTVPSKTNQLKMSRCPLYFTEEIHIVLAKSSRSSTLIMLWCREVDGFSPLCLFFRFYEH